MHTRTGAGMILQSVFGNSSGLIQHWNCTSVIYPASYYGESLHSLNPFGGTFI